ncbi:hypothetical protein P4S83_08535 [Aneurinibacillus thermoaerophilus]|uniref:hypothetical protein n=1 Tax=Aneurinibacillus thermoaerophilus TaxID=143495 RepID=UPI002E2124BB|nr:hypothetical protein [Aneurinibacillus thermoaerophilus]MED0763818.1 hypothetical protein [Aneurinibacillus thermoaerophilus]
MAVGGQKACRFPQDRVKPFGAWVIQRLPDTVDDGQSGLIRQRAYPFALGWSWHGRSSKHPNGTLAMTAEQGNRFVENGRFLGAGFRLAVTFRQDGEHFTSCFHGHFQNTSLR